MPTNYLGLFNATQYEFDILTDTPVGVTVFSASLFIFIEKSIFLPTAHISLEGDQSNNFIFSNTGYDFASIYDYVEYYYDDDHVLPIGEVVQLPVSLRHKLNPFDNATEYRFELRVSLHNFYFYVLETAEVILHKRGENVEFSWYRNANIMLEE